MIEVAQGSEAWHELRSRRIGASDAAAVMGVSPWATRYSLWLKLTGRKKEATGEKGSLNYAIERGNRFEPAVRARYELISGVEMKPSVRVHPKYDFIMCSTDGDNPENGGIVLEIKCAGKEVFDLAKEGHVHEKYIHQLDQQLMVTGYQTNHFYVARIGNKNGKEQILETALVVYKRDEKRLQDLENALVEFWGFVERDEQPPLVPKDVLILESIEAKEKFNECKEIVVNHQVAQEVFNQAEFIFEKAKEAFTESATRLKDIEKEIARLITHPRVSASGLQVTRFDYKDGRVALKYKIAS